MPRAEGTGPEGLGLRLVYAADLHGEIPLYAAVARLVTESGADALVLGGDQFAHTRDPAEQVAAAADVLPAALRAAGVPVFAIAGNVDWPAATAEMGRWARLLTLAPVPLGGGVQAVGYPLVPPTPFRQKWGERRDAREDPAPAAEGSYAPGADGRARPVPPGWLGGLPSIEEDLAALDGRHARALWVAHTPPYGCALDEARSGAHVGSRALRRALERVQPPLALHGHIHESPAVSGRWAERIGRTLCVNPGRGAPGGPLHAVVADLEGTGSVRALWHTVWGDWAGG